MRNFYCRQRRLYWAIAATLGILLFFPSLTLADNSKSNDEGRHHILFWSMDHLI